MLLKICRNVSGGKEKKGQGESMKSSVGGGESEDCRICLFLPSSFGLVELLVVRGDPQLRCGKPGRHAGQAGMVVIVVMVVVIWAHNFSGPREIC